MPTPVDPNAHYYFFSALIVILTTASAVLGAVVLFWIQTHSGKVEWARARFQDASTSSFPCYKLEALAQDESAFLLAINSILDSEFMQNTLAMLQRPENGRLTQLIYFARYYRRSVNCWSKGELPHRQRGWP